MKSLFFKITLLLSLFLLTSPWCLASTGQSLKIEITRVDLSGLIDVHGFGHELEMYLEVWAETEHSPEKQFVGYYPIGDFYQNSQNLDSNGPVIFIPLADLPTGSHKLIFELVENSLMKELGELKEPVKDGCGLISMGCLWRMRDLENYYLRRAESRYLLAQYNSKFKTGRWFLTDDMKSQLGAEIEKFWNEVHRSRFDWNEIAISEVTTSEGYHIMAIASHPFLERFFYDVEFNLSLAR